MRDKPIQRCNRCGREMTTPQPGRNPLPTDYRQLTIRRVNVKVCAVPCEAIARRVLDSSWGPDHRQYAAALAGQVESDAIMLRALEVLAGAV